MLFNFQQEKAFSNKLKERCRAYTAKKSQQESLLLRGQTKRQLDLSRQPQIKAKLRQKERTERKCERETD